MLSTIFLIVPDFGIILLGIFLARRMRVADGFWKGVEKLVYFVLFPPLLFHSVATSRFDFSQAANFLFCGIAMMMVAVVLSYAACYASSADEPSKASAFQCNFRFNSYIGFALALNMCGREGFALMALFTSFWVPISSSIAVTMLAKARAGRGVTFLGICKEIGKNPLILSTTAGLLYNVAGFGIAAPVELVLTRLGSASLALGLLAIGAALRFDAMCHFKLTVVLSVVLRLLIVPIVCLAFCRFFDLDVLSTTVLFIFAALPTANSCYILAVNMGGNGPLVAAITTAQTLAAMATMPVWIVLGQRFFGL